MAARAGTPPPGSDLAASIELNAVASESGISQCRYKPYPDIGDPKQPFNLREMDFIAYGRAHCPDLPTERDIIAPVCVTRLPGCRSLLF